MADFGSMRKGEARMMSSQNLVRDCTFPVSSTFNSVFTPLDRENKNNETMEKVREGLLEGNGWKKIRGKKSSISTPLGLS